MAWVDHKIRRPPLLRRRYPAPPKCDICQEASGYFFCLEDRALLCRDCDVFIHLVNSLVSVHQRLLLTGVQVGLDPADPVLPSADKNVNIAGGSVDSPTKHEQRRNTAVLFSGESSAPVPNQMQSVEIAPVPDQMQSVEITLGRVLFQIPCSKYQDRNGQLNYEFIRSARPVKWKCPERNLLSSP